MRKSKNNNHRLRGFGKQLLAETNSRQGSR